MVPMEYKAPVNIVKLYALRCCGGNGIWDIPLSAISHFSLWQIFFGISHFPPISQFQVHSRCGELKLGYPKIPKYGNIVVVAKRKWDIPHIPALPNIPKNNVLPLWQKKNGISSLCASIPQLLLCSMWQILNSIIWVWFFLFIIHNWCTCSLQNIQYKFFRGLRNGWFGRNFLNSIYEKIEK